MARDEVAFAFGGVGQGFGAISALAASGTQATLSGTYFSSCIPM